MDLSDLIGLYTAYKVLCISFRVIIALKSVLNIHLIINQCFVFLVSNYFTLKASTFSEMKFDFGREKVGFLF
jgi:hypothetical protein